MTKEELLNSEGNYFTLYMEDGTELECSLFAVFTADGRDYAALLPLSGPDEDSGEVYLYRFIDKGDEDPELENIPDDEELEIASDAFDEYLDALEFDTIEEEEL